MLDAWLQERKIEKKETITDQRNEKKPKFGLGCKVSHNSILQYSYKQYHNYYSVQTEMKGFLLQIIHDKTLTDHI